MQSFLQYRRFGRQVEAQYERDKGEAHALKARAKDGGKEQRQGVRGATSSSTSSSSSSSEFSSPSPSPAGVKETEHTTLSVQSHPHTKDPEKAERAGVLDPATQETKGKADDDDLAMDKVDTKKTIGTALGTTLTGIEVRSRTTREGGGEGVQKVFVVGYEGASDPMNPHNWSRATRIGATVNIASIGWIVGFASSVDSAALMQASKTFGVSEVAESLATGLFLVGFGVGSLFAGPISETVGRNPVYIATLGAYMLFIMGAGFAGDAGNFGAQLATRFLAGCFASTPLTCAGGSISDLWSPLERVWAFPVFANAAFMGPIFGPVIGGFVGESKLISWRWTEWITLIISGLVLVLVVLFQPETYAPVLLAWKAKKLRQLTSDDRYRAEIEIRDIAFIKRLGHALYRPFLLTFSEPIVVIVALYLTVIYIILFTFLDGYAFIFTETYGFSEGITGLSFIGIGIGLCFASCLVPLINHWTKKEWAKVKDQGGNRLAPEIRLWYMMFGSPAIPISLFWMGWTAYPSISYWSPLAASVLFGYGILCVFISCYQYIIDSYEAYSASALASATLIRYVAAGGMVEVAVRILEHRCSLD
ncbi:uncharacterized protein KY384_001702 [Bacidia gigantensis]|uniref:uncharacterized protein n=1 Tax=Bacidia gigantensis TaxID=2732470 RepID=UPI001D044668|nr:uncharacterized protein KY384_001702 [Bacidia gigantensis]KAG8533960.1 hypothetical protein KY384_001702 [Bacidia gigantensis]